MAANEEYKLYAEKKEASIVRQTCVKAVAEMVKGDLVLTDDNAFIKKCRRLEEYIKTGQ